MNLKLMQTRLNSLDHYADEIEKLKDALRITEDTRTSILNELKEFCPFVEGDLFLWKDNLYKFKCVLSVYETDVKGLKLSIFFKGRNTYGNPSWYDGRIFIPLLEIINIKIIS